MKIEKSELVEMLISLIQEYEGGSEKSAIVTEFADILIHKIHAKYPQTDESSIDDSMGIRMADKVAFQERTRRFVDESIEFLFDGILPQEDIDQLVKEREAGKLK